MTVTVPVHRGLDFDGYSIRPHRVVPAAPIEFDPIPFSSLVHDERTVMVRSLEMAKSHFWRATDECSNTVPV